MIQAVLDHLKDEKVVRNKLKSVLRETAKFALHIIPPNSDNELCCIELVHVLESTRPVKTKHIGAIYMYPGTEEIKDGTFIVEDFFVKVYIGRTQSGDGVDTFNDINSFPGVIKKGIDLLLDKYEDSV